MQNSTSPTDFSDVGNVQKIALGIVVLFTAVTVIIAAYGIYQLSTGSSNAGVYGSFASGTAAIVGIFLTSWSLYQSQAISERQIAEKHKLRSWEWYNSVEHVADDILSIFDEAVFARSTNNGQVEYSGSALQEAKPKINSLIDELVQEARHPPTGVTTSENEDAAETLECVREVKSKWLDIETRKHGVLDMDDEFFDEVGAVRRMADEHKSTIYPENAPEGTADE